MWIRRQLCFVAVMLSRTDGFGQSASTVTLDYIPGGNPFPRYGAGTAISFELKRPVIRVFRPSGQMESDFVVNVSEASRLLITEAAAGPNGKLVALATAQNSAGETASLLVWLQHNGRVERVVKTTPYAPMRAAFDHEGNLWTAGRVYDPSYQDVPGHNIVRQYDSNGQLVRQGLPSSVYGGRSGLVASARMATCEDGIGIWMADTGEWVEWSSKDREPKRTKISIGKHSPLGVACAGAYAFATVDDDTARASAIDVRHIAIPRTAPMAVPRDITSRISSTEFRIIIGSNSTGLITYGRAANNQATMKIEPLATIEPMVR